MTTLSIQDMQHMAIEVSGLAQGVDQLHFNSITGRHEAIPPMLTAIAEKSQALASGLDKVNDRPANSQKPTSVAAVDQSEALSKAVTLKYLIENAANLDNEGREEELTTVLGVLCEKATELVDTLDPPRSMAAE